MRKLIYNLINRATFHDRKSKTYNWFISSMAVISILPLMFKKNYEVFDYIDEITVYILFIDYILRWIVSDYILERGRISFLIYPFSLYAIVDIVSLLPSISVLGEEFRVLRMMRIFKICHYSNSIDCIIRVFKREKDTLTTVLILSFSYIFISALVLFTHEPDTFSDFFDALYWATTALTTVGYGDIYPRTDIGKFISMLSSIFGIAIITMPAGIITASFLKEIEKDN